MIRAVLGVFWSHWRRNRVQLATLVLGIALATALWTGVQAINAEARAGLEAAARSAIAAEMPRLERRDGGEITVEDFVALRRAGVLVAPVLSGPFQPRPGTTLTLTGIDPLTAPAGLWPQADATADPAAASRIFLPPDVAAGPGQANHPAVPEGQAIADIGIAQRELGRDGFDALILTPPQPLGAPDPQAVLPGLVQVAAAADTDPADLTQSFRLNLTAFGALCFIVGLFIVRATVGLAMAQRRRTVGVLRALGVPLRLVGALMLAELALIAACAGLLGVVLGYLLATALMPGVSLTLDGIYGARIGSAVALRPVWWLGGLAIAVLGTLASAAGPLLRTARGPVIAAPARARPGWLPVAAGLALLALSAALAVLGGSLTAGFAAMAALLLGAAALTPSGLSLLLRAAAPLARGPVAQWTLAETRAQIPQMSLAMTALLMALSANIGVGTMVDSFRRSFSDFIDQRLAAELYVATPDGGAALSALLGDDARPLPITWADAEIAGQPSEIYAVVDDPTYREDWPLLTGAPDAWDRLYAGRATIINEQLHYRSGLGPGDMVTLPDGPAEIVGIIADYGNPLGKLLVSQPRLDRIAPGAVPARIAIRTDRPQALRDDLIAGGIPADRIALQAELKSVSLRIFERTFAVTAALNTLTLAVAGFAVLTSLLTIADSRLPRLAPLWSMGLDRRHLARLELVRVTLSAALTAMLALPVGLALCWLLLTVVNVEAFGWRLPFRADPGAWLLLMGLGCLAAVLAALWPAWRLSRISPRALSEVQSLDQ
ncbi:putative ABC transport system permease protein [Paracoccus isoporae]|uniref:Putative ABC transport system permease protein n=1 Tax=Paracoccus isoporae TaxID=591205 RepID=A0A1G6ZCP8_9RHOB|nr:FtsX-like permease family protein [Paracoccus isoporae]SDD99496.1 putative ABC transport system permease protein [Paracoccus isoporae]